MVHPVITDIPYTLMKEKCVMRLGERVVLIRRLGKSLIPRLRDPAYWSSLAAGASLRKLGIELLPNPVDIGLTEYQKMHSQNLIPLFPFMTAHHTFHKKPRWAIVMAVILCRALTPSCRTTTCPWLNIDGGSFGPSGCPLFSLSSFLWLRTFRGR